MTASPRFHDPLLEGLIRDHPAPLRIEARFHVDASPRAVFGTLGDLEGITRYFPMIHRAVVHHPEGCAGDGSERVCSIRGMGDVTERIVWWREPVGYAYRANGPWIPLQDHLGVISIAELNDGSSLLDWRQYFNTRYGPMGWMFPPMMRLMMGRAVSNLAGLLGATSEAIEI